MFPSLNLIGQTIYSTPPPFEYINRIVIKNGVYDDFYATRVDESIKETDTFSVPESWDAATYLHAKFNGDIFSGNSDFGVDNTTNILIKRRVKGTYKWLPLFDIPADCSDDYNFVVVDKYAASRTLYEYAAVPIINGVEASYSIASCKVEFDNLVIIDKDDSYDTRLNIEMNQSRNTTCGTVVPIESRYPIYVANSANDYYSGHISATFIKMNGDNVDEDVNPSKYRDDIMSFLNNRKPKFIKHPNGNCWIAAIGNAINDDDAGHPMVHHTSFDFTEIGNTESSEDLSRFGFVDIGEEWW